MDNLNGIKVPKCEADIDQGVQDIQEYCKERYKKLGLPIAEATAPDVEVMRQWFANFARVAMDEIRRLETERDGQKCLVKSLNLLTRGW